MLRTVLTKTRNTWYKTKRKSPTSSSRPGQSPLGEPRPKKTQKRSTSNSSNAWTKRTTRIKRENAKKKPNFVVIVYNSYCISRNRANRAFSEYI